MTQCNIQKYMEKTSLVLRIRVSSSFKPLISQTLNFSQKQVTIKEVFDNFSIGNELLDTKGKILRDFHSLISNQQISDFKFIVEGKEFYVHKVLLAGKCTLLDKLLMAFVTEAFRYEFWH